MKFKTLPLITLMFSSALAFASAGDEYVLPDGAVTKIMAEKGQTTGYIEAPTTAPDGTMGLKLGRLFTGLRLVKATDGTCFLVTEKLSGLKELTTEGAALQIPTTGVSVVPTGCSTGFPGEPVN